MTRSDLERKAADLQAEIRSRRDCGHNTYMIEKSLERIIDDLLHMYPVAVVYMHHKKPRQEISGAKEGENE